MRLPPRMASLSASLRKDAFKTRSTVTGQMVRNVGAVNDLNAVRRDILLPAGWPGFRDPCDRVRPMHLAARTYVSPGSQKSNRRPICIVRGGKAAVGTRKLLLRRFPVGAA